MAKEIRHGQQRQNGERGAENRMRIGGCVFPYCQDQGGLIEEAATCSPGDALVRGRPFFVGAC